MQLEAQSAELIDKEVIDQEFESVANVDWLVHCGDENDWETLQKTVVFWLMQMVQSIETG